MSERGSVYRHGTLRWTCAPRSKRPPFAYRSASPTDLTKCPHCVTRAHYWEWIASRTAPSEAELVRHMDLRSALRGELRHADEHTRYDLSTFMQSDSPDQAGGRCEVVLSLRRLPFKNVFFRSPLGNWIRTLMMNSDHPLATTMHLSEDRIM